MIAFLTGKVVARAATYALLDVGGVGFRLAMSTRSLAELPAQGDETTVFTHLHVREDDLSLFGFATEAERVLFERFITVSGIGPKVALAMLSSMAPDALERAIASEDIALLSSVPGIGKKTAQRLVVELKDKMGLPDLGPGVVGAGSGDLAAMRDALLAMGFSSAEAAAALADAAPGAPVEQLLGDALRRLGGSR